MENNEQISVRFFNPKERHNQAIIDSIDQMTTTELFIIRRINEEQGRTEHEFKIVTIIKGRC